jgi:hypothetical protein
MQVQGDRLTTPNPKVRGGKEEGDGGRREKSGEGGRREKEVEEGEGRKCDIPHFFQK